MDSFPPSAGTLPVPGYGGNRLVYKCKDGGITGRAGVECGKGDGEVGETDEKRVEKKKLR